MIRKTMKNRFDSNSNLITGVFSSSHSPREIILEVSHTLLMENSPFAKKINKMIYLCVDIIINMLLLSENLRWTDMGLFLS